MLGLGSNITSISKVGTSIVTDGLVLKHDYRVAPVQPVSSGAAFFDGTNDFINLESRPGIIGHKSITAWVYMTANQRGAILRFGDVMVEMTTATEVTVWADVFHSTGDGDTPTALNNWRHIAATLEVSGDDSIIKVYADGVFIESTTVSDSVPDTSLRTGTIGSYQGSRYFSGYICNVGLWSGKVLSQPQVKSIMQKDYAGLSNSEKTDLVSWWNLDNPAETYVGGSGYVYDNHYGGSTALSNDQTVDGVFNVDTAANTAGTNWTTSADWVVDNGIATLSGTTNNQDIRETTASLTQGTWYKVSLDVTFDAGSGELYIGSSGFANNSGNYATITHATGSGSYEVFFRSAISSDGETFNIRGKNTSGATFTVTIDNITIQKINGNTGTLS